MEDYEMGMNFILKDTPDVVFINVDSDCKNDHREIFSYCDEINNLVRKIPLYIALSVDETKGYKALKNNFFDYIVKPGKEIEIRKAILHLLKNQKPFLNDTLCLKSYKDYTLLEIDDVVFLEAQNNSTEFVLLNGRKVCAFKTLKTFEMVLPNNFLRIHHSYMVNKNHISRINFGKLLCFLNHNKISLPFSKSYRHNLISLEIILAEKANSYK